MAFDPNDEILQDFLIEAGEIIELLDEQLVDMEKNPNDSDLLNAIFRGFHTVKGGAGFLSIEPLVILCHRAEDIFNFLRQGELKVSPELMDVILDVHDNLRRMFSSLNDGVLPDFAETALVDRLDEFCNKKDNADPEDKAEVITGDNNITDDEFEDLLDKIHGSSSPGKSTPKPTEKPRNEVDEISDEEFELLLDSMHGVKQSVVPNENENDAPENIDPAADEKNKLNKNEPTNTDNTDSSSTNTDVNAKKESEKTVPHVETTVRVDTSRLDDIMNLVGELVLVRNRLSTLATSIVNEEMSVAVNNLDLVTSDLQTAVMKTRMQPVKKVFGRFPRVVRDLSRSLNKEIDLVMVGEETDLDKNLVEALSDPLVHLVRNSVDHGIEMPDEREKSGKNRRGTITLSAKQEGEHIILSIHDDGAGMDVNILKNIAIKKGILDEDAAVRMSDEECYSLIFLPGFSTKDNVSDISGRGVGMDVVKTKISELNGSIIIRSEMGKGTTIEIKVPLTLAIMPTLMVMVADQVYAIPLASVIEIFNFDESMIKMVDGQEVVLIRNKPLPIFHLNKWLSSSKSIVIGKRVVVVSASGKTFGFVVESLLGQEEVVIKPLGALLQGTKGMSGATITGDGKISLILDVPGLMKTYACGA